MSAIKIRVGSNIYEHTRALFDGAVKIERVEASFETADIISDIFEKMVRQRAFDVSELGLTFYLRTLDLDEPPFIALPIFPNRNFRHSAIFINTASGIEKPEDLVGKTIGEFAMYGHDAGVWAKGILADEYGVKPEQCRWIIGGPDWPMPEFDFVPPIHPANVDITAAPADMPLAEMLEAGEIDAFISAITPQAVLNDSPKVARLFPDYDKVERAYYQRTGIFPIMHTVVIRRDLLAEHPELGRAIYDGFCEAKESAMEHYRKGALDQHMDFTMPWTSQLFDENRRLFPRDWWPYGVEANRTAIDTYLRYHFEQGLSKRRLTCDDIFIPELLGT